MTTDSLKHVDINRDYLLFIQVGGAGSIFLVIFGINALLNDHFAVGTVLLLIASLVWISMIMMHFTHNNAYGSHGISLAAVISFAFLIITGGIDNTGPLWCYPLALIIVLLQGFTRGLLALICLFGIAAILLFHTSLPFDVAVYPQSFKIRFLGSFIALSIMALIYEYLRRKSYLNYLTISRELEKASRTDALTGLANRRDMQESLEAELGMYLRHGHPFSVIMADLDHFKIINDDFGHSAGDKLLVTISHLLSSGVRRQDLVARWGGEEFYVLLPNTRYHDAMGVAEKLRVRIERADFNGINIPQSVTVSFGVQCICNTTSLSNLIQEVDERLYKAKNLGRNCVVGSD